MLNKSITVAITATGTILASTYLLSSFANAQNTRNGDSFLQSINQEYLKLQQSLSEPMQNITTELNQGIDSLQQEIQSRLGGAQSQIDHSLDSLGIPDIIRKGQEIERTISELQTGVLHLDARLQSQNGKQLWHQQMTSEQAGKLLSLEGQEKMLRERETAQAAVATSTTNAEAAQTDHITQEVMKKMSIQNAQTATLLQQVQSNLQEQNNLTAVANVNLSDISHNLATAQRKQQLQEQGLINANYKSAVFSYTLWSEINK